MRLPRLKSGKPTLAGRNRKIALRMFNALVDWFEANEINYSLEYGTLLGAIREGDFIAWDDDLDFTIFADDLEQIQKALPSLEKNRSVWVSKRYWGLDAQSDTPEGATKGKLRAIKVYNRELGFFKGRIHADFYIKSRLNDGWYWQSCRRACRAPFKHHDSFETIEFLGRNVRVPADVEDYLTWLYRDWRTPKPEGCMDYSKVDKSKPQCA